MFSNSLNGRLRGAAGADWGLLGKVLKGLILGTIGLVGSAISAQPFLPLDVGTTVNGFQDDFEGSAVSTNWVVSGADVYSVGGSALHVVSATGDPNHLLFGGMAYDGSVQEVLARIRVTGYGSGDGVRCGVAVAVDPSSSQGIDYHFRDGTTDGQPANHISFLDDLAAWGPAQVFVWQPNIWYWMRLRQEPDAAGGSSDVFGKIWLADGSVAEPVDWQLTWDYNSFQSTRSGLAGLAASSSGGPCELDVDYILIKAAGLPTIFVAPDVFVRTPAAITTEPQSLIVPELAPAGFSVVATGNPAPSYQWLKNDKLILGGTNSTFDLPSAPFSEDGARFQVIVQNLLSNVTYAVTSRVATLTVIADTNPPVLLGAQALGPSRVQVSFSEPLQPAAATNLGNYSVSGTNGSPLITAANLDASQTNVVLAVSSLIEGAQYTLTVNNLIDRSAAANVIAPNSHADFVVSDYALVALGNAVPPGKSVLAGDGYDFSGGGAGLGGTNDQAQFGYLQQAGDFDFRVRLDSLGLADAWSEAGLMAREALSGGARFAAILATPSISGAFFKSRAVINGAGAVSGSFPVNYPNTWLRLKRAGNNFVGFAGFDGQNWTQLGSMTAALPASIFLGFVVSSHDTNQVVTAGFRDFSPVSGAGVNPPLRIESLGQASRSTGLVISEIMYHPTNSSLEFVELFNTRAEPQDMSGYQLGGSVSYTFPAGVVLPAAGFLVVARSPADLQNGYGISGVLGPYANTLPHDQGTVRLISQGGGVLLEVNYGTTPPWPVSPDGAGHSLVLVRPSYGEGNVLAWAASDSVGGSPGKVDPISSGPFRNVLINEFLADGVPPVQGFIELFNRGAQPLDLSGCSLSDDRKVNKFLLPPGSVIPARGFLAFEQSQLGFTLNPGGGTIYFRNASATRVLDALFYEGQQSGVSFGRVPDGEGTLRPLVAPTPGFTNSTAVRPDVVINEILYAPVSLNDDEQFVELYNRGASPVDLSGWKFVAGLNYTFPDGRLLQPDSYVVVARNAARMLTNYPNLNATNLVGNFSGTLSHKGERIALAMVQPWVTTNAFGSWVTNLLYPVVNEVSYGTGGRWGDWSHGGGSSLELIDPRADNSLAANWADSDETRKAPWTVISATGTIDNGSVPADELQVLIQGVGECLVDNVQVLNAAGVNLIANSTFESGAAGWVAEGTEKTSNLESREGYQSHTSYHLRAVEKGDNQVNRVRTRLTSTLPVRMTNVTIQAAARWLRGDPDVLLRLRGNWLECAASLPVPTNPGTPGARNSRYVANAPPAISEVAHAPVLPAASQPIIVTARANDPNGISTIVLYYRLDPSGSYATLAMRDDGAGPDAIAGDGVYSATIPGQQAGTMVAFFVQASDGFAPPATATFPNDAPARECLVRVGESQPTGNYPVYRLWMTQASFNTWNGNNRLDNSYNDVTFVLGDQRVIYNSGGRFKGSPYISPGYCGPACGACGYSISFPSDDLFLGDTEEVLDWPGGHGGETTGLQEQMCYWIADRLNLPWSHRHTVRLQINGVTDDDREVTFEAVVQPAGGFVSEWSPNDSNGELFKIERAFEFNDGDGLVADPEPRLQLYTTTGGLKKREHYRWNWMFRATDRRDDYSSLLALVDAINSPRPEPYTSATSSLVDIEEWMGIFATEHIIVNFDAYGHEIGKNMYAYKPDHGKWQLYMFDLDWAMLAAPRYNGSYAAGSAPLFNAEDPTITKMYAFPPFARAYWRAVQRAVAGPFDPTVCNPVIDAKSRSLFANGIAWCDGQRLTQATAVKTWFSQRRVYLQKQLATVAAPFGVTSTLVTNNQALVSGTAPVEVETVRFDGIEWPLTWTSVKSWQATVPLQPGTNSFSLAGVDVYGVAVPGDLTNVVVFNDGGGAGVGRPEFIPYLSAGAAYEQDFDSLPNPGANSINAANPVVIDGLSYSLSNPFGFALPAGTGGNQAGLDIAEMGGWYSLADPSASTGTKFGASFGDQTTGGAISFGLPGGSNRALGLLATSSTGSTAFGAKFINQSGATLRYMSLQFIAELWRQSNLAKTLEFYYFVDPTATRAFSTNRTGSLPALNVAFPTLASAAGGIAVDGTAPENQTKLMVLDQVIADWAPGAALWLVWQMADSAGKAQGLAIDQLRFSATEQPVLSASPPLSAETDGRNLTLSWPSSSSQAYQLEATDALGTGDWIPVGQAVVGTGAPLALTNSLVGVPRRFFRLRITPE